MELQISSAGGHGTTLSRNMLASGDAFAIN